MMSTGEKKELEIGVKQEAGFEEEKIPASAQTPSSSPPSLPKNSSSPPSEGSSSPPPPSASPPPESPPSPPPTPPSSPPPSSSTPQPNPPLSPPPSSTPSKESPDTSSSLPSKPSSSPPPSPLAPTAHRQPQPTPTQNPQFTPPSPPSPSFLPSSFPPSPIDSEFTKSSPPSQPASSPLPSVIPQVPNLQKSPFQAPSLPTIPWSTPRSSYSSPPSPPGSGSKSPDGNSNKSSGNNGTGNGNSNSNRSYNEKTMVGIGIAGAVVIAFLALVFYVRRRKNKSAARHDKQQYMPPPNFSVQSDGYYYGQKAGMGNSGRTNPHQNSQQNSSNSSESQKPGGTPDSAVIGSSKTFFTYEELTQITGGFSRKNVVGEGGFGCVYKGFLSDGKTVAVKQLKAGGGQGDREFKAEVEIISRVHHKHLVTLVGYCISEQHRLLIYEFVPNKTLEHHLHGKGMPVLEWAKRLKIAVGSAKGLAYLHEDCNPKIIHRDIKSANILLDDDFEAQVADFGLARLNDTTQTHVSTRVMGTFGYLAPEYASSGKLTDRSDVFSFGVVLLELITGRKPVDPSQPLGEESLVEWARRLLIRAIETGDISELVDPRLEKHYLESEVYRMIETAASCVRHSAPKRPRMVQVLRALDSEGEMSDLSNGVKVGHSTAYDSSQYSQDIKNFRKMALGSDDFSDSGTYSGDYTSHEYMSHESETQAFNTRRVR